MLGIHNADGGRTHIVDVLLDSGGFVALYKDLATVSVRKGQHPWSGKYIYDSQGLMTDAYDARQVHTQFSYDGLNRLTQLTYTGETSPTQTPTVTYTYDQAHTGYYNTGRLTQVSTAATTNAPATAQAYNYDKMGRVVNHSQTVGSQVYTTGYGYNVAGWLTSETYPSGRVISYSYDEVARLKSVQDTTNQQSPKTYLNNLSYAAHGGMTSATLGNGNVESVGYNNRLQATSLSLSQGSNVLQQYQYKYGQVDQSTGNVDETKNNGQIARIEGYIGTSRQWQQRYSYDSVGRLTTAGEYRGDTLALTYQSNYSYDRWGNRYQHQAQNSQSLAYTPVEDTDINPATNRLTNNTSYDNAGNVTADSKFRGLQYKYDGNGRMWWSANLDNSGQSTAVYDGLGQRVQTTVNGNTKTLVYNAFGQMVAEYNTQVVSLSGGVKYLMADLQGSTRVVTDGNRNVIARHDYQAFGSEIGAGVGLRTTSQQYGVVDSTRQKYAMTERDEATGLDHTWWRKYESGAGRWTTPDPYKGSMELSNPQSFNRYSYALNDPANLVDPSGLHWEAQNCHVSVGGFGVNTGDNGIPIEVCQLVWVSDGPFSGVPTEGGGGIGPQKQPQKRKKCNAVLPNNKDQQEAIIAIFHETGIASLGTEGGGGTITMYTLWLEAVAFTNAINTAATEQNRSWASLLASSFTSSGNKKKGTYRSPAENRQTGVNNLKAAQNSSPGSDNCVFLQNVIDAVMQVAGGAFPNSDFNRWAGRGGVIPDVSTQQLQIGDTTFYHVPPGSGY